MPRYAVVEQSTDMQYRQTGVRFTTSLKTARRWSEGSGGFTYSDPAVARNWHRTVARIYELPLGWRRPGQTTLYREALRSRTSAYRKTDLDVLADIVRDVGREIV